MYRKLICLVFAFLMVLMTVPVFGADILAPGDFIIPIDADGGSRSPDNETAPLAIDGDVNTKYLNFGDDSGGDEQNTGFIVTPAVGASVVASFDIWTANDAEERDPATWELYGTNEPIVSIDHSTGDVENWTLIDSGSVSLPVARFTVGSTVTVSNTVIYASYKMLFPTVKNAVAANSMQIAEVQFYGPANAAWDPDPADGSNLAPQYAEPNNVYMILDYTPGSSAITHTAYFSDVEQDVIDRDEAHSLGVVPPWPAMSDHAFVVGYDDPGIPEYARAPLVGGTTYYWCIDEFDGEDIWYGNVWSFTLIPEHAWDPSPYDGQFVPTDATLTWQLGDLGIEDYSVKYDVYVGTDETAVADANVYDNPSVLEYMDTVETASYDITDLEPETEYFWRIDTKLCWTRPPFTCTIEAPGIVWSFTTLKVWPITDATRIGWWSFDPDSGDLVLDQSGYGNDGTILGGAHRVPGKIDDAIDLNGSSQSVQIVLTAGVPITVNPPEVSVCMWVKPDITANERMMWFTDEGGSFGKIRCHIFGGNWQFRAGDGGDNVDAVGPVAVAGEWVHYVGMKIDNDGLYVYIDGALGGRTDFAVGGDLYPACWIGAEEGTGNYFDGLIDDVQVYLRALSLKEIKLMAGCFSATDPDPANGAGDVPRTPTLSWEPGAFVADANGNVVYYSEDLSAVTDRIAPSATVSTPPFIVPIDPLDLGVTFYWVVDTVNDVNTWPGDVWTFTTIDWISVDDMEPYVIWSNPVGPHIFTAWRDGFGDCTQGNGNETGSVLTENPAPVLAGIQSMKYEFDNDGTVYSPCTMGLVTGREKYSRIEAQTATLPSGIGSDWTVEGVKALSLSFHGQVGNATTEPFWVQLQDGAKGYGEKVFYGTFEGESLDDFNEASWHEWNIDLADFDVDLNDVVSIVIGIGNEDQSGAHGSGTLYLDDIRLYTPRCMPQRAKPAADFDDSCQVDYPDVAALFEKWLLRDIPMDLFDDEVINFRDYSILMNQWLDKVYWP